MWAQMQMGRTALSHFYLGETNRSLVHVLTLTLFGASTNRYDAHTGVAGSTSLTVAAAEPADDIAATHTQAQGQSERTDCLAEVSQVEGVCPACQQPACVQLRSSSTLTYTFGNY